MSNYTYGKLKVRDKNADIKRWLEEMVIVRQKETHNIKSEGLTVTIDENDNIHYSYPKGYYAEFNFDDSSNYVNEQLKTLYSHNGIGLNLYNRGGARLKNYEQMSAKYNLTFRYHDYDLRDYEYVQFEIHNGRTIEYHFRSGGRLDWDLDNPEEFYFKNEDFE